MLRAVVTGSGGVAVHVVAGHRSGALFALHSLHQLLEPATAAAAACVVLPGLPLKLHDTPEFSYRGLLIDSARHKLPVVFIQQVIEVLSFLKMAHLHWHLTDDVSFALPVTALPDRLHPMCAPPSSLSNLN